MNWSKLIAWAIIVAISGFVWYAIITLWQYTLPLVALLIFFILLFNRNASKLKAEEDQIYRDEYEGIEQQKKDSSLY